MKSGRLSVAAKLHWSGRAGLPTLGGSKQLGSHRSMGAPSSDARRAVGGFGLAAGHTRERSQTRGRAPEQRLSAGEEEEEEEQQQLASTANCYNNAKLALLFSKNSN